MVLVCELGKFASSLLQTHAFLVTLLPDLFDVVGNSGHPDLTDSANLAVQTSVAAVGDNGAIGDIAGSGTRRAGESADDAAELLDGRLRVTALWQVADEDGSGSSQRLMLRGSEPLLASLDEVLVLADEEVECPRHEDKSDDQMTNVSIELRRSDISVCQNVEPVETSSRCDGAMMSAHHPLFPSLKLTRWEYKRQS